MSLSLSTSHSSFFSTFASAQRHIALRAAAPSRTFRVPRRTLFIQTQATPNPDSLKFVPGVPVLPTTTSESMHFGSFRDASNKSELAVALFRTEGVTGVFLTRDFISVNKTPETHWHELKPMIFAVITDFFESGRPVLSNDGNTSTANTAITEEDDDIVAMIKELLETRVRPAVQADGGDIIYRGFTDGVVLLQMQGSCQGCPSSAVTLKKGIERMLMHWIPEVQGVMAVDDDDLSKINLSAFKNFEQQQQNQEEGESSSTAPKATTNA